MNFSRGRNIAVAVSLALAACAQLPAEWDNASAVENFTQSQCTGNPSDLEQRGGERISVEAVSGGRLKIDYLDAHFRCDQRVTGYVKTGTGTVEVLVAPADMNPAHVAKCDCLYNISLEVPKLPPGTYDVTVQRRWDNRHSVKMPVRIGTKRVTVQ